MFHAMCEMLDDPWATKFRSLLTGLDSEGPFLRWEDITICSGQVEDIMDDAIVLDLFPFKSGSGFIVDEKRIMKKIFIPGFRNRSFACAKRCHITCAGVLLGSETAQDIHFRKDVILQHRPELQCDLPWDGLHLFCGAFDGWSRALNWLAKSNCNFSLRREVHVDSSPQVMDTWAFNHASDPIRAPVQPCLVWDVRRHIGVVGPVSDMSVLHVVESQSNLMATVSPPCVSWSRGGKARGLACDEGWASVEALQLAFIAQANVITLECADELASHKHAPLLDRLLMAMGYVLIWKQVVPLQLLTHNFRTRWLSVWARASDPSRALPFALNLIDAPRTSWFQSAYTFALPSVLTDQLHLSGDERRLYGDWNLLPPAKKSKCRSNAQLKEVLEVRVASSSEPLPTLCANYTVQHCLDPCHLRDKGIFAFLISPPWSDEPVFAEPTRCCCLLGPTSTVSMPLNVRDAFHHLGNAIAVPHALLAVGIGLTAVACFEANILQYVKQCWDDRLTSTNAILICGEDFWTLMPCREACQLVPTNLSVPAFAGYQATFCVRLMHSTADTTVSVPCHWTFARFLLQVVKSAPTLVEQIRLRHDDGHIDHCAPVDSLQDSSLVRLWLKDVQLGWVRRVLEAEDISPTAPFTVEAEISTVPVLDFQGQSLDSFCEHSACTRMLRAIESLDPVDFRTRKHEVTLAVAPLSLVIRFPVQPTRIESQLQALADVVCEQPLRVLRVYAMPDWISTPIFLFHDPECSLVPVLYALLVFNSWNRSFVQAPSSV